MATETPLAVTARRMTRKAWMVVVGDQHLPPPGARCCPHTRVQQGVPPHPPEDAAGTVDEFRKVGRAGEQNKARQ